MLDLVCLIVAFPLTILYKVVFGGSQASPPFTSDQVASITSTPIPWPHLSWTGSSSAGGRTPAGPSTAVPVAADRAPRPMDSSNATIFAALGGLAYGVYAIVDIVSDGLATQAQSGGDSDNPLATVLSYAGIALSLAIQGFSTPFALLSEGPDQWDTADQLRVALWGVGFLPTGIDILTTAFGPQHALAKYMPTVGPIGASLAYAVVLGAAVATTVEEAKQGGANGWTEANNIIAPIPGVFSFLVAAGTATDGLSTAFLMGLAAVCDFGSAVTEIAGSVSS